MSFNFTHQGTRNLYSKALKEQIEIFGLDCEYWRVDRDESKDELYNEDTKPLISAKYDIKLSATVLEETYMLSRFGIEQDDELEAICSKEQFEEIVGDDEKPNEGDYIYIKYTERIMQIADVKDDNNIFHENKFSYKLMLRPADISGEEVTENIGIEDWEIEESEIDDSNLIETLDNDIVIEKDDDSSPYSSWE